MNKVRAALTTLVRLVKNGPFSGNHRVIRFDDHTLAASGEEPVSLKRKRYTLLRGGKDVAS